MDRSSRLCRKLILRPSPDMVMKNPANSVKPKSEDGYGNAELADPETGWASVEALHGAPFGVKTKPDSHRKVSQRLDRQLDKQHQLNGVPIEQSVGKLVANSGNPKGFVAYGNPELSGGRDAS